MSRHETDSKLDLVIERTVRAPRELVWAAWTQPEHVKRWFTPAPWMTTECEIDLKPGGIFRTVMRGPEGEESVNVGCYLELVPNERLVWTIALEPGFRPASVPPALANHVAHHVPVFTAVITFEKDGTGTRYRALAKHRDEAGKKKHEEMGFHEGWGAVTDQLIALTDELARR